VKQQQEQSLKKEVSSSSLKTALVQTVNGPKITIAAAATVTATEAGNICCSNI